MNTFKNVCLVAGVVFASMGAAHAQSGPVAGACEPEIEKYCADMSHGQRGVRTCLEDHRAQVSATCKEALDSTGPGSGMGRNIMAPDEIVKGLEEQGYTKIRKVERERRGKYEVKALDPDGYRVELYVDGMTGEILKSERDN